MEAKSRTKRHFIQALLRFSGSSNLPPSIYHLTCKSRSDLDIFPCPTFSQPSSASAQLRPKTQLRCDFFQNIGFSFPFHWSHRVERHALILVALESSIPCPHANANLKGQVSARAPGLPGVQRFILRLYTLDSQIRGSPSAPEIVLELFSPLEYPRIPQSIQELRYCLLNLGSSLTRFPNSLVSQPYLMLAIIIFFAALELFQSLSDPFYPILSASSTRTEPPSLYP